MNRFFSFLLIIGFLQPVFSQKIDFKNYTPLTSQGPIPADFVKLSKTKYEEELSKYEISSTESKSLKRTKSTFLLESNYSFDKLIFSGRVLYGDALTEYVRKVAHELLKNEPELEKEIKIYTLKSSSVNAASSNNGTILIDIGLLAYLNSEAELAFVLAHEISHYVRSHPLNSYVENYQILKGKGNYSRKSFDEKIDLICKFSKESELEADSLGFVKYLNSNYDREALSKAFDVLHYSYLPYKETPLNKNFFNCDLFRIPPSFFKDSVSRIKNIQDYNDQYHTHPNIAKRKEQLNKILANTTPKKGKQFIVSEEEFKSVREIARFEMVRLDLLRRDYGNAIYNCYLLLQQYPDNKYLETTIAKALYGLAKYKNADEYHMVARSFTKLEGESQQLHYLLKQFDRKQLNVLALKYIKHIARKHKDLAYWDQLEKDLIRELVVINKAKPEEFFSEEQAKQNISLFEKQLTGLKVNQAQKEQENFYKAAFASELKDEKFKAEFYKYADDIAKLKAEENMSYDDKIAQEKKEEKELIKNGPKIFAKKIVVLDPFYAAYNKNKEEYVLSEKNKLKLDDFIVAQGTEAGLNLNFINSKKLISENGNGYNNLSLFKEWLQDRYSHGKLKVVPLFSEQVAPVLTQFETNLVCHISIYWNKNIDKSFYEFIVYDTDTGKEVYISSVEESGGFSDNKIKKLLLEDFKLIQR